MSDMLKQMQDMKAMHDKLHISMKAEIKKGCKECLKNCGCSESEMEDEMEMED